MTARNDDQIPAERQPRGSHFSIPPNVKLLDTVQLAEMERSFRVWAGDSPRLDICWSRQRILLIFLLLRHTGAKLHEILELHPQDIDHEKRVITLCVIEGETPTC